MIAGERSGSVADSVVGGPEVFQAKEIPQLAFEVLGTAPKTRVIPFRVAAGAIKVISRVQPAFKDSGAFILSTMSSDAVGEKTGSRTLRNYFMELKNEEIR